MDSEFPNFEMAMQLWARDLLKLHNLYRRASSMFIMTNKPMPVPLGSSPTGTPGIPLEDAREVFDNRCQVEFRARDLKKCSVDVDQRIACVLHWGAGSHI